MNKINTILTLSLIWALGSCNMFSDTYDFLQKLEVQWSFTPAKDEFTKEDKLRIHTKTADGTGNKIQLTLYNNSEENLAQMKVVFTQVKLWFIGKEITSGIPFDIGEAMQVTFTLEPEVNTGTILIAFYAVSEVKEMKPSTYHLELIENQLPTADFTYKQVNGLEYEFDASVSTDKDRTRGGAIAGCDFTVTDKRAQTIQKFSSKPGEKVKHAFPRKGEFHVKLTVRDQDLGEHTVTKDITVN